MSSFKFELNSDGVRELLKSEEAAAVCRQYAGRILQRAGEGYVMEDRHYQERSGAAVRVNDAKSARDNLQNNTLLKALGGAGE